MLNLAPVERLWDFWNFENRPPLEFVPFSILYGQRLLLLATTNTKPPSLEILSTSHKYKYFMKIVILAAF